MYCTIQDISDRLTNTILAQLTDDENGSVANAPIANKYIHEATALIDSYLRGRYTLPLIGNFDILTNIALALIVYGLRTRRGTASEQETNDYKEAKMDLLRLQKGIITLEEAAETASTGHYFGTTHESVFPSLDNYAS
jgi:phage gp36-like protein